MKIIMILFILAPHCTCTVYGACLLHEYISKGNRRGEVRRGCDVR